MKSIILLCFILVLPTKTDKKILFEKLVNFEHVDFKNLHLDESSSSSDEIPMVNYQAYKSNVSIDGNNFSIFLVDTNHNKIFTDNEDVLMINPPNTSNPIHITLNNMIKNPKNRFFSINSNVFEISSIVKNQNKYEATFNWDLKKDINQISFENRMIDKIPSLDFVSIENKNENLSDFLNKGKYIYVEFWATWCSPCVSILPEIEKLNRVYSSKVEVISLVSEKALDKNKYFDIVKKNNMGWHQGYSNTEISEKLSFNILPRGYLFNPKGDLVLFDASPTTVKKYLDKITSKN